MGTQVSGFKTGKANQTKVKGGKGTAPTRKVGVTYPPQGKGQR